ncbi:glycosyl hydrolase family 2 [Mariniflexile fucanivorans]|uniref:Glycosyl hydrolase family 2 n=1 Tax=Mariniflexile fucanivorans TaxID=264023 RepID=A0A4R1RT90_9FLAO|nr:glycoside hydrolase family 2 TIM barrel-domain containing protein [Mariniflexile fucanivorans]TCL69270.1 glycosyl hydrolase family 2 [Mariniflexile fucanivorans]
MKTNFLKFILFLFTSAVLAQTANVSVVNNEEGMKLVVNGNDFMINGMNWDYFPIGTNYSYSLWSQSDAFIKEALDAEMSLLKNMGVNSIRVYTGIQPKWIQYIYENYGIYTMLNHPFGRYGVMVNNTWVPVTNYSDEATQKQLLLEVSEMVEAYKNTPGLLLYLLGNENNYGLFWAGAETEDFPDDEHEKQFIGENRGRPMYKLMNDAVLKMKSISTSHPFAICNGDVLFIDIIAEECKDVDIFGVNMYRGISFVDAFQVVKEKLNKPILFTEFGSDAFNTIKNKEDQKSQAYYNLANWKEIYENVAGQGKAGNAIGGYTFQFSDGWWKHGQTTDLDIHDTHASWANAGYKKDYKPGKNNMNEEWFGICEKGPTNSRGLYKLYPRAAYYVLKEVHKINPYSEKTTLDNAFKNIKIKNAVLLARNEKENIVKSIKN